MSNFIECEIGIWRTICFNGNKFISDTVKLLINKSLISCINSNIIPLNNSNKKNCKDYKYEINFELLNKDYNAIFKTEKEALDFYNKIVGNKE